MIIPVTQGTDRMRDDKKLTLDSSQTKEDQEEGDHEKSASKSESSQKIENLEHLGKYITIANSSQNTLIAEKLKEYDITRSELPILIVLYKEEGVSQQKFSELYGLDKSTVTRTLDKLSEKGFTYRETSPEDRRKNLIKLTEKAKEFKPILINVLEEKEEYMNKGLSEGEKQVFRQIIKKMIYNLKEELCS